MKPIIRYHDSQYECVLITSPDESELHLIDDDTKLEYTIISHSTTTTELVLAIITALRDAPGHFAGLRDYAKDNELDWQAVVSATYKVGVLYYCGWDCPDGDVYSYYYLHHIGDGLILTMSVQHCDDSYLFTIDPIPFSCHFFAVAFMHNPDVGGRTLTLATPAMIGLTATLLAAEAQALRGQADLPY